MSTEQKLLLAGPFIPMLVVASSCLDLSDVM